MRFNQQNVAKQKPVVFELDNVDNSSVLLVLSEWAHRENTVRHKESKLKHDVESSEKNESFFLMQELSENTQ